LIPVFLTSYYQVKNAENNFFENQSIFENSNDYNENINRKVINDFYTAFKNSNVENMVKLYHPKKVGQLNKLIKGILS